MTKRLFGNRTERQSSVVMPGHDGARVTPDKKVLGRREILKALGLSVGAAAAVPATSQPAAATESRDERLKARYRESAEVKRFYETNRYPK